MTGKEVIKNTIDMGHEVLSAYLSDLGDADLMVRAVPGMNHIAWQLGHLIASENDMLSKVGYTMPPLPDGFVESYTKETSESDDAAKFEKKDVYMALLNEQRGATMVALESTSESDFDKPAPEPMREYAPTIGAMFNVIGVHTMMHAPQFIAVRRLLGKPITI